MEVSYRAWVVPSLERGVPRDSSNGGQIHPGWISSGLSSKCSLRAKFGSRTSAFSCDVRSSRLRSDGRLTRTLSWRSGSEKGVSVAVRLPRQAHTRSLGGMFISDLYQPRGFQPPP